VQYRAVRRVARDPWTASGAVPQEERVQAGSLCRELTAAKGLRRHAARREDTSDDKRPRKPARRIAIGLIGKILCVVVRDAERQLGYGVCGRGFCDVGIDLGMRQGHPDAGNETWAAEPWGPAGDRWLRSVRPFGIGPGLQGEMDFVADEDQVRLLQSGVTAWNRWRDERRGDTALTLDFRGADLRRIRLQRVNLSHADLREARLQGADLWGADLSLADCSDADLSGAILNEVHCHRSDFRNARLVGATAFDGYFSQGTDFTGSDLTEADLEGAYLAGSTFRSVNFQRARLQRIRASAEFGPVDFSDSDLSGADLGQADLSGADLSRTRLVGAYLGEANLSRAWLASAVLTGADLRGCQLVRTTVTDARMSRCQVYGAAAWSLVGEPADQRDLVITQPDEPAITVDDLEVAQFIYLLLNNAKIRNVIDSITSKVVLILGRFTEERKAVLDALRDELRRHNLTPIIFDFAKPASKDVTGTVETLARMARFVVADLTDPSSIPHELATTVPFLRTTPVVLLRLAGSGGFSMVEDLANAYEKWVLPIKEYPNIEILIQQIETYVTRPAEARLSELRR
jgi:uncharacterized protein YjbI with pentapeptide repeats